jgi:murein DD-endopeptidase MepM/ murein hydrolase activator NlpD
VLLTIFLIFTFAFNFLTLKWAAATQHPWLAAIVLADQREESARVQERVQGHLNAMAIRLGELQAQMMRLEGLGERLAKTAGLKPQELPSLQPGVTPGRGGAESSLPSRNLGQEFSDLVGSLRGKWIRGRTAVGAGGCSCTMQPVEGSADALSIIDGWYSRRTSATDRPFTGQQSMHESIDFPAGARHRGHGEQQVVHSRTASAYGKNAFEIDHGNGLVSCPYVEFDGQGRRLCHSRPASHHGQVHRTVHRTHLHFQVG